MTTDSHLPVEETCLKGGKRRKGAERVTGLKLQGSGLEEQEDLEKVRTSASNSEASILVFERSVYLG